MRFPRPFINSIKNLRGFTTKRRLIVFSVDDYGNVRLDSKDARERMDAAGLRIYSRFDAYDSLETMADLEMLFDCLQTVKDKNGNPAVFTPYALPCNINFEKMAYFDYEQYFYETLPETFEKLSSQQVKSYTGAWNLWQQGMNAGLLKPQFHGREHFNLKVFNEKLSTKDKELLISLKNRSLSSISKTGYSTIGLTAAFDFLDFKENELFKDVLTTGLALFKDVFGYNATNFNAPGAPEHHSIHHVLESHGIKYLDTPWIKREHQGFGNYRYTMNFTGKRATNSIRYLVRNVVFEPTENNQTDWVGYTMKQIQAAFRLNKPAIISSHRVNFCGNISPKNRSIGISALKSLLKSIVRNWHDVEFVSASTLGDIVANNYTKLQ